MSAINKKRIDKLIPNAIEVINQVGLKTADGKVSITYHGYFSTFGADMILTTPLAAIIFYEEGKKANEEGGSGSKEDRKLVPKAIVELLRKELGPSADGVLTEWEDLSTYYSVSNHAKPRKIANIIAAATALKIALRTFPKS